VSEVHLAVRGLNADPFFADCAHIVRNYAEQLSEEEASRHNAASKVYISQPQPQMVHAVPIHYGGYNQDGYYGGNHSRHGSSEKMLHHSSV